MVVIVDALHSGYLKLFEELLGNKNMILMGILMIKIFKTIG